MEYRMNSFKWNKKSSVGVDAMDDDHRKLFEIINNLYDSINRGEQYTKLQKILAEMIQYSRYHFKAEEDLMRKFEYPELRKHVKAHVEYIEKIGEIRKQFKESNSDLITLMKIQDFLGDWWINHIEFIDKKYGVYLKSIGANTENHI